MHNDAKYCHLSPFMYLVFILKLLPTCASITESLRANNSFFQDNGEVREILQLNRPYGLIGHPFSVLSKSTHASELRSGKGNCRHPFISVPSVVLMWNRDYWHNEQHSLGKGVVKEQLQRCTFYNFFSWYCNNVKSTPQCKLNLLMSFSSITCGSHSEMSSNGK